MVCVVIPVTVIYNQNKPIEWYFYSRTHGEMKRRTKYTAEDVIKRFSKIKKKGEVIAVFIHKEPIINEKQKITIEYFNLEELGNPRLTSDRFLKQDSPAKDGILQEFVEPLESNNNEYIVNWSERLNFIERAMNKGSYLDKRMSVYDRYTTAANDSKLTTTQKISSELVRSVLMNLTDMMSQVRD